MPFVSAPPSTRTLYLYFALAIVLSTLAITPLQPASGKGNSVAPTPARAISDSDVMFIPPTISLTSPPNNATFIAGSTLMLGANALDSDGTISKVEFFQGAVKLGEDATSPYSLDWTNVPAGGYVLTARATDNVGEITTSGAINITVITQVKQYVDWSSITNGIDLGNGSVRKTSSGSWDFSAASAQTLLPGDGYFESTAANYNQWINLIGADGSRTLVIGGGGWAGIYENGQEAASTCCRIPSETISVHVAGDRYRLEISNGTLRYIRYRSGTREVLFTTASPLPAYPLSLSLSMSPQNAEWQKTMLAQLTRKATWSSITNGIDLGNGSVRKTSSGSWDFSAASAQTLLPGDGYFESTAANYNQAINLIGADGSRMLVIGGGGWAGIYENGQEVASTCCRIPSETISVHVVGDRYRLEISNGTLRYIRYRSGTREVLFTTASPLPAYPLSLSLSMSPQNAEWQNTAMAQLSQTVSWSSITNGIDLGNGSVRKTSSGTWDFSAVPRQQLIYGNGYFESTAASSNQLIILTGADGLGRMLAIGAGGWAGIYENGQEVASTCCRIPSETISVHVSGDRYRLEISGGKLRYVRYRSGARNTVFISAASLPAYPLSFSLAANPQNAEWQNTVFSDNLPEHNDAAFVSQTVPTTMVPGQTYSVSVTMTNTGRSTWTPDGDYQLASENLPDNQRWGLNRVNLTTTVLPGSNATFSFTVTAPPTGSHSFQWRMVQQGVERFGVSTTNVNVQTVNGAPTVSLNSPASNATFIAGATITLSANASDSDGTVSKVEFFQGSVKLGEDTTAPYSINWTNVPAGSYMLTTRATDNGGATATSSVVNITVNAPNVPPSATIAAPTNNAIFANDAAVLITGSASDSDGIVNKVEFFQGAIKLGDDTNGSDGFNYTWTNVPAGTYSLTIKATDNAGATTTSSAVSITVNLPVVSVAATDADAAEPGSNTGVFTVSRTGGTSIPLTVNFSVSGAAVAGADYTAVGTAVTIPSGAGSQTIVITPIDDTAVEGSETVSLTLSGNAAYTVGTPASATATIADNDHYPPIVSITSPAGGAVFTTAAGVPITANASEQDGTISQVEFFQSATKLGEDTNGADGFSYTWANAPEGSYSLTACATDSYGVAVTSPAVQVSVVNFNLARLDPFNRSGGAGEDPLSRNFNWSVGLVGLSGRAGLDLGLSLSYNSLVWTRSGSYISFNDDGGFPSAGFRLGFPVIQPLYYNSQVGKNAFLLIGSDGSRTELRQVNASALYEAADSSHLLLDTANNMALRTTDGTQLLYEWKGSDYQCTEIKDRNGNFITVNYTGFGRIDTVVDTLSRSIKFNYDGNNYLSSITQTWTVNGQPQTHTWATFAYSNPNLTIQTTFSGVTNVGPQNGSTLKVLTQVTVADGSRFNFEYTSWGQIWKVSNFAVDGHLLNYRSYDLPLNNGAAQSDCPRFTERRDWAENWNRSGPLGPALLPTGSEQEVVTTYAVPVSSSWTMPDNSQQAGMVAQVTLPDGTYNKIYFPGTAGTSSGWQRGLPTLVETFDPGNTRQRQSATTWAQDNTAVSYPLNPRVTETNTYDPAGNRARRGVTYQSVTFTDATSCNLPQDVYEYQANATTVLRRTHTEYNLATTYTGRRIIGLASEKTLYEFDANTQAETLMSKVAFQYDELGSIQGTDAPVQHDNTNYGPSFVSGRANLGSVKRYDVVTSQFVTSSSKYNTAGSLVETTDPANHQVSVSYTDAFSADGTNLDAARPFVTLAYPTAVTDADGYSSSVRYHYDFGAATWKQTPLPNTTGNTPGPSQKLTYDSIGRLQRITNLVNNAYTRLEFPLSQTRVDSYATIQEGLGEAHSFKLSDGHGRVIAAASDHPASAGGFSGQLTHYDLMGRVVKSSNPTETNASGAPSQWAATGDDALAGWLYTQQTYDWKGRPLVATNPDETTKEASYGGCGCAGGQVVTLTDEGTVVSGSTKKRQQKIYSDVLGRTLKTEALNWDGAGAYGTDGSVYSTTVNSYNARDQLTRVRQYQGAESSGTYQDTTISYDGFGRLKTKHVPEQQVDPNNSSSTDHTTWDYNADDTVQKITDARGASQTFSYNVRHLVTAISYAVPGGSTIPVPAAASYAYDAAGNRTSMTDGLGGVSYQYDTLSRLTSETRTITGVGTFPLSYVYNLSGALTSVTDSFAAQVGYVHDQSGRLTSVTGSGFAGISNYASGAQYRAWGALKHLTYGNSLSLDMSYNTRLQSSSFDVHSSSASVLKSSYQYNADGAIRTADDQVDSLWDRSYSYDFAGRITAAGAGAAAGLQGTTAVPYYETFGHDAFDNLTGRVTELWSNGGEGFTAAYANNRRQSDASTTWQHDAAGNVVSITHLSSPEYQQYAIDAAGRTTQNTEHSRYNFGPQTSVMTRDITIDQSYGGDGRRLKRVESNTTQLNNNTPSSSQKITYDLRSSALGGRVIMELNGQGQKEKSYVFAGGELLAVQQKDYLGNDQVLWSHTDPVSDTTLQTNASGQVNSAVESQRLDLDPMGGAIPPTDPALAESSSIDGAMSRGWYMSAADPFNPESGCAWDGMSTPCRQLEMIQRYLGVNKKGENNFTIVTGRDVTQGSVRVSRQWVEDDGPKRTSPEDPDVIVTDINADGLGHYEFNVDWFGNESAQAKPQNSTWPEPGPQPSPKGFPCPPDFMHIIGGGRAVTEKLKEARELSRKNGREEGGWIYMNRQGKLKANPKGGGGTNVPGLGMAIDLWYPPILKGSIVVGTYHTHDLGMDPSMPTGEKESLPNDLWNAEWQGVPGIILGPEGTSGYGPNRGYWGQHGKMSKRCQK